MSERAPVAPEMSQFAEARAAPTPRPEIVFRTLDRKQISYYVMNADGGAKTLVTSGRSALAEPAWSSQGSGTSADPYRFAQEEWTVRTRAQDGAADPADRCARAPVDGAVAHGSSRLR